MLGMSIAAHRGVSHCSHQRLTGMEQAIYFAYVFNLRIEAKVRGILDISNVLLRDIAVNVDRANFGMTKIHVADTSALMT